MTAPLRPIHVTSRRSDRLRTYLIGVGIGLMLTGVLILGRQKAASRQAAERAAASVPAGDAPSAEQPAPPR